MLQWKNKPLPTSIAKLCLQVRDLCLAQLTTWPASLLIAYSGGADSKALTVICHCLGLPISLAHVDHALRPESKFEAQAAQDFAYELGLTLYSKCIDVRQLASQKKIGLEEAGRLVRYDFFQELNYPLILTGHHLDDLGEDVILRLLRGSGWPALGGLKVYEPQYRLLRPLLYCRKTELENMLQELGLEWCQDASNNCLDFKRNRIRHQIMPELYAENPNLSHNICNINQLASIDHSYWQDIITPLLQTIQRTTTGWLLPKSSYIAQPQAVRLRLYLSFIRYLGGQGNTTTLLRLDQCIQKKQSKKIFQFPGLTLQLNSLGLLKLF